jgi:hypothetical protein
MCIYIICLYRRMCVCVVDLYMYGVCVCVCVCVCVYVCVCVCHMNIYSTSMNGEGSLHVPDAFVLYSPTEFAVNVAFHFRTRTVDRYHDSMPLMRQNPRGRARRCKLTESRFDNAILCQYNVRLVVFPLIGIIKSQCPVSLLSSPHK